MSAPQASSSTTGTALARWTTILLVATTAVLIFLTVASMFWVVPTYRALVAAAGMTLSFPARLAIEISRFGVVIFLAGFVALTIAGRQDRTGARGAFNLALCAISLSIAIYLGLVCTVYLDYARLAGRIAR